MAKYVHQDGFAYPIDDVCEYCDGWGVLEQSDEPFCPHCVNDEYYNKLDIVIKDVEFD